MKNATQYNRTQNLHILIIMLNYVMLSAVVQKVFMLSVAFCYYADCYKARSSYTDCCCASFSGKNVKKVFFIKVTKNWVTMTISITTFNRATLIITI